MSKSAKAATSATESPIPFEEALTKLESIVEAMETAELPLEQLLGKFEDGARLAKLCQNQLAAAELRVQQLEKLLNGDLVTRPVKLAGDDEES